MLTEHEAAREGSVVELSLDAVELTGDLAGWRVARVGGEVDIYVASRVSTFLADQVAQGAEHPGGARGLVVDLSALEFIDSAGLGVLVGTYRRARAAGLELRLSGASAQVRGLLSITGLTGVLPNHDDAEQAARAGA